jgi:hypothetical protein
METNKRAMDITEEAAMTAASSFRENKRHLFRRDDHFLPGNLAEEVFACGDVLVHQT